MRSKELFCILCLGLSFFLPAECFAQWRVCNPTSSAVHAIAISGASLFSGCTGVYPLDRSTDNGSSWTHVDPTNNGIDAFATYPNGTGGMNLFAAGGGVFFSADNGSTWADVSSGLANYSVQTVYALTTIQNGSAGSGLLAGTFLQGIFRSTDNGTSWTPSNSGLTSLTVDAFAANGANLFAGTLGGGVFRSTNNGVSWSATTNLLYNGSIEGWVYALVVHGGYLFAGAGTGVYRSSDNGASWTSVGSGMMNLSAYAFASYGNSLYVGTDWAGGNGGVYVSTDYGAVWTNVSSGLPTYSGVFTLTISNGYLFAGTENGVFLRPLSEMVGSTNSSPGWSVQSSGISSILYEVKAVSSLVAWSVGSLGVTLVTTNGGSTWNSVGGGALGSNSLQGIEALDARNAFVTFYSDFPYSGYISRTTDAGATWKAVFIQSNAHINGIKMYRCKQWNCPR